MNKEKNIQKKNTQRFDVNHYILKRATVNAQLGQDIGIQ